MQFSLQTSKPLSKAEVYLISHRSHLIFLIIFLSFFCLKHTWNFNCRLMVKAGESAPKEKYYRGAVQL